MRVLLISNGGSYYLGTYFRDALQSLNCDLEFVDEWDYLKQITHSFTHRLAYHLLHLPLTYWALNRRLVENARNFRPQVVLITKGSFISPETLTYLKKESGAFLVNYATDDPFNPVNSTRDLLAGIPLYDLYVCTKRAIMDDIRHTGCSNVVYVPFGYEPSVHYPEILATSEDKTRFTSDLVFIGGADVDRIPIFKEVAKIPALNMHLYGGYWNRNAQLRRYYRGFALGRDYRLALSGAKIALGLVRRANRDGHSMRTFEIPACGAFMLAERTEEHLEFFAEDKEAVYFTSNQELLDKVAFYLRHEAARRQIAEAGYRRVTTGGFTYRDRLVQILECIEELT